MKEELGTVGIAIGMAILLCLLIGSSLPIYPVLIDIWCFVNRPEAPAWIQAIGSIVAVAVAIYVPERLQKKRDEAEQKLALAKANVVSRPLWERVQQTKLFFSMVRRRFDAGIYIEYDSLLVLVECKPKTKIATEEQLLIISVQTPLAASALSECNGRIEDALVLFDKTYHDLIKERGFDMVKNSNSNDWHSVWSEALSCVIDLENVLAIKNKELKATN